MYAYASVSKFPDIYNPSFSFSVSFYLLVNTITADIFQNYYGKGCSLFFDKKFKSNFYPECTRSVFYGTGNWCIPRWNTDNNEVGLYPASGNGPFLISGDRERVRISQNVTAARLIFSKINNYITIIVSHTEDGIRVGKVLSRAHARVTF